MRARSHGMPSWCTHRIALVRGVMAASISAGSMLYVGRLDVDEDRASRRSTGWRSPWR